MKVILHDCTASWNLTLLFAVYLCAFLLEKYSKDKKKADNIIQFWQLGRGKKHSKQCFSTAAGNKLGGSPGSSLHNATQGDSASVF